MAGIKDQSKLTGGKGFKTVMAPFSHLKESGVIKTITAPITHLKNALRTNKRKGGKV
jgi:hypothetical protein